MVRPPGFTRKGCDGLGAQREHTKVDDTESDVRAFIGRLSVQEGWHWDKTQRNSPQGSDINHSTDRQSIK